MSQGLQDLFKQINNALLDLQASELQTFERPLKNLSRLLQSDELKVVNDELIEGADLDGFVNAGMRTGGSFVASKQLQWPEEPKRVMGLTLMLIYKFGEDPRFATDFGTTFYYSGNKIIAGLHSVVRQLLIPFVRDYKDYVMSKSNTIVNTPVTSSDRIFIVHGHDGESRETVARFVQQIGFKPVILHEQANQGRTVIEKVEANSDVGFAIVLLTPDEGCKKGGIPEPRARQNVLLELGYFIGKLGRDRVCTLKKGDVNIPSDFAGVVWESMELSNWKQSLGRELSAAGYVIDWNKAMQ
jgi:predicted nucleotide-binding protein